MWSKILPHALLHGCPTNTICLSRVFFCLFALKKKFFFLNFTLEYTRACWVPSVVSDSLRPYGLYSLPGSSLSMGFSRQEYQSGLPCPSPEDLPSPGIEPRSPESPALAGGFFTSEPPGKAMECIHVYIYTYISQNTERFKAKRKVSFALSSIFLTETQ